jgi:hypothetical protein
MQSSKLPLTIGFLAIYLIRQAKTGLSALALKRHLGVSYPTAWLIHHKLMQAMAEREACYILDGPVQVDDAYLGGERSGGKAGRGSQNKVPFVAAVSLNDEGHPLRTKLTPVSGFRSAGGPRRIWLRAAPCSPMGRPASAQRLPQVARTSRPSSARASPRSYPSSSGSIPCSAI